MTLSVYGITTGRQVPRVQGVHLRGVRVGRLTAIVSVARRAPTPTHTHLRRYHRIVAAVAEQLPALLPARFGTTMDETELMHVLRARAATLQAMVTHVRGRVQMTLRTTGGKSVVRSPAAREPESGTAYLRRLSRQAAADADAVGLSPVRAVLHRWVRDERVDVRNGIASVYHLVPRGSAAAYARAAAAVTTEAGGRVVVSGPFPPFAFGTL